LEESLLLLWAEKRENVRKKPRDRGPSMTSPTGWGKEMDGGEGRAPRGGRHPAFIFLADCGQEGKKKKSGGKRRSLLGVRGGDLKKKKKELAFHIFLTLFFSELGGRGN